MPWNKKTGKADSPCSGRTDSMYGSARRLEVGLGCNWKLLPLCPETIVSNTTIARRALTAADGWMPRTSLNGMADGACSGPSRSRSASGYATGVYRSQDTNWKLDTQTTKSMFDSGGRKKVAWTGKLIFVGICMTLNGKSAPSLQHRCLCVVRGCHWLKMGRGACEKLLMLAVGSPDDRIQKNTQTEHQATLKTTQGGYTWRKTEWN